MKKLSAREMTLLGSYALMLALIAIYFGLFRGVYPQVKTLNAEILAAEQSLEKIQGIVASKEHVETEFGNYRERFFSKRDAESGETAILQDIKSKAVNAGLSVNNVKPIGVRESGGYNSYVFRLETEGELVNLGKFLYELDTAAYIFAITLTQINAQSAGEPLSMQFLISTILASQ